MPSVTPDTHPSTQSRQTRTQAERTATMRNTLLDATVDSLVELGYARTTTQGIARRAGVSRGAQLHHFPTKESLVVAAVEHLVEKRMGEILSVDKSRQRGIEILADAFSGPLFLAALELWVAARTDPALHEAMVPLERKITETLHSGCSDVFGDGYTSESIELSIELVRGFAVSALFRSPDADRAFRDRLLPVWESKMEHS
ncbi:TetR/AcrR family transcriptional regulator [Rhodococcus sp. NPDC058521]|uniref:TetR/AcrR family transcriptional regulator n=1 Tax=Rhodococcus sp. NPDC058521 TaxID=3346536 RepID=UPI0036654B8E